MDERLHTQLMRNDQKANNPRQVDPVGFKHEMTMVYLMLKGTFDKERIAAMHEPLPVNRATVAKKLRYEMMPVKKTSAYKLQRRLKPVQKWMSKEITTKAAEKMTLPKQPVKVRLPEKQECSVTKVPVVAVNTKWQSEKVSIRATEKMMCLKLPLEIGTLASEKFSQKHDMRHHLMKIPQLRIAHFDDSDAKLLAAEFSALSEH